MKNKLPDVPAFAELFAKLADTEDRLPLGELRSLLQAAADEFELLPKSPEGLIEIALLRNLADSNYGLERDDYPDRRGIVLTTRDRLECHTDWFLPSLDDGDDEPSKTQRKEPISLSDHTGHVATEMQAALNVLPVGELESAFREAVARHDWGKADERFQAMLRRMDRTDAWLWSETESSLLAKSDGMSQTKREREADRIRAELPRGFRHEILSVQTV